VLGDGDLIEPERPQSPRQDHDAGDDRRRRSGCRPGSGPARRAARGELGEHPLDRAPARARAHGLLGSYGTSPRSIAPGRWACGTAIPPPDRGLGGPRLDQARTSRRVLRAPPRSADHWRYALAVLTQPLQRGVEGDLVFAADDQLGRAAADVDHQRRPAAPPPSSPQIGEPRSSSPSSTRAVSANAPQLGDEGAAVLGVPHRARRDRSTRSTRAPDRLEVAADRRARVLDRFRASRPERSTPRPVASRAAARPGAPPPSTSATAAREFVPRRSPRTASDPPPSAAL